MKYGVYKTPARKNTFYMAMLVKGSYSSIIIIRILNPGEI